MTDHLRLNPVRVGIVSSPDVYIFAPDFYISIVFFEAINILFCFLFHALGGIIEKPRLLDRVQSAIRVRYYSHRTEQAHTYWIRQFILFHDTRQPMEMGAVEVLQVNQKG